MWRSVTVPGPLEAADASAAIEMVTGDWTST
jgi:hypothetical protein